MAKYVKTVPIEAEQFDPDRGIIPDGVFNKEFEYTTSDMLRQMAERALTGRPVTNWHVATLEGNLKVAPGDWIATGIKGEHWAIADDVFQKTYAKLPVIPKVVAHWIEHCKCSQSIAFALDRQVMPTDVQGYFKRYRTRDKWIGLQDTFARAWLDGYQVEGEDVESN